MQGVPDGTYTDGFVISNVSSSGEFKPFEATGGMVSNTVSATGFSGYWVNGQFYHQWPWEVPQAINYLYAYPPTPANSTEKAFAVAKQLVAKKRVTCATPEEFIALVEELKEVL